MASPIVCGHRVAGAMALAARARPGSAFRGTGQTCVCANRIYVHSSIYTEFASKLAEKVAAFKVGDGLAAGVSVSFTPVLPVRAA